MILVGQYDSPFVRRVAVSLRLLDFAYDHDTRSVFADFAEMRRVNPLGRIPSLVLDDGETLIDSAAILDWLDQSVGPERALIPVTQHERRRVLQRMALATGAIDKAGAVSVPGLDRTLPYPGDGCDRSPRRRGLADAHPPRPGVDHHRLHDPLRSDIRS
jgi:glutathione S-transferase